MKTSQQSGFTLLELMIVVTIITILSTIAVVSFRGVSAKGRDAKRKADIAAVQQALERYYDKYGTYHVKDAAYLGSGIGWLNFENGTNYKLSVIHALFKEGLLPWDHINDPNPNAVPAHDSRRQYMIDKRGSSGIEKGYCLYSVLENKKDIDYHPYSVYGWAMHYRVCGGLP